MYGGQVFQSRTQLVPFHLQLLHTYVVVVKDGLPNAAPPPQVRLLLCFLSLVFVQNFPCTFARLAEVQHAFLCALDEKLRPLDPVLQGSNLGLGPYMLKCLEKDWVCLVRLTICCQCGFQLGHPCPCVRHHFLWIQTALFLPMNGTTTTLRGTSTVLGGSEMILGTTTTCNGSATTLTLSGIATCPGTVALVISVGSWPPRCGWTRALRISCHTARERCSETRHPLRGVPVVQTNNQRHSAHAMHREKLRLEPKWLEPKWYVRHQARKKKVALEEYVALQQRENKFFTFQRNNVRPQEKCSK